METADQEARRLEILETKVKGLCARVSSLERRAMHFSPLKNILRNILKDRL